MLKPEIPPGKARSHFTETEFSLWTWEGTSNTLAEKILPLCFFRILLFKKVWLTSGLEWLGF